MDLMGCPVCALAGSGGAVVAGYLAGRSSMARRGRRVADRRTRGRTMRSWPGGGAHHGDRASGMREAEQVDGVSDAGSGGTES